MPTRWLAELFCWRGVQNDDIAVRMLLQHSGLAKWTTCFGNMVPFVSNVWRYMCCAIRNERIPSL
eukprot:1761564-Alexandrium_andersonii.AAC.1